MTFDQTLYALIAMGSAALAWDKAIDWRFFVAIGLAGAVALKAKRSSGAASRGD